MRITHREIIERDIDYSIISSILNNKEFERFLLSKINEKGELTEIYHSLVQTQTSGGVGESDIVLLYNDNGSNFAIFIEDKINADPQPNQRARYDDRAIQLKKLKKFDRYYVILCAPKKYLSTLKSEGYEICISFEEILELLTDELTKSIFLYAIEEKSCGYTPIKDELKTKFWEYLYSYVDNKYTALKLKHHSGPRGSSAVWPIFTTYIKGLTIVYKSDRDYIDLEFAGMANRNAEVLEILKSFDLSNYVLVDAHKSLALRFNIPKEKHVEFDRDFNNQITSIDFVLNEVSKLNQIADKLTLKGKERFPL